MDWRNHKFKYDISNKINKLIFINKKNPFIILIINLKMTLHGIFRIFLFKYNIACQDLYN